MQGKKYSFCPCAHCSTSYAMNEQEKLGGASKMQEKKRDDKELICVNVDKVYDWIVRENTFDIIPSEDIVFLLLPDNATIGTLADAIVTCEVVPAEIDPIEILSRVDRQFCIDGKNVCLQQLTIRKNFTVRIIVTVPTGVSAGTFISEPFDVSRNELVTLCAPEGTDVEITYTELDCFVVSTGVLEPFTGTDPRTIDFSDLNIAVHACQSIQSTFPVTVELLADFCEPREDFPTVCSAPSRPSQCPQVFPDGHHGHHGHNRHCN